VSGEKTVRGAYNFLSALLRNPWGRAVGPKGDGSTARFRAIALAGYRPKLTLTVEGTGPPVTQPTMHVHSASGTVDPLFNGSSGGYQFSRVYTTSQWSNLRLPTYVSAWDNDTAAPTVLMEIDLGTRTATRVLPFPTLELYPTIDAWAP
jgi:hypothetical protein